MLWSGHGTIKGVDISFDGGDNWAEAKLKGLVLPKSWTRFSYIIKWDGKPMILASRSYDDFEIFNLQLMKKHQQLVLNQFITEMQ